MISVPFSLPCWQRSPCWHSPSTSRHGKPSAALSCSHFSCLMALPSDLSLSELRDPCRPLSVPAQGMKPARLLRTPQGIHGIRKSQWCVPSLCHLLVWHMIPELCLPLLPSPLLPAWVLSVFFYIPVLFFPALPLLFLHSGSPRGPQPRHGRAGARHRWVPLLWFIFLHFTVVLWSHSSSHLNVKHPARFLIAQPQQESGNLCSSAPWGGEGGLPSIGSAGGSQCCHPLLWAGKEALPWQS